MPLRAGFGGLSSRSHGQGRVAPAVLVEIRRLEPFAPSAGLCRGGRGDESERDQEFVHDDGGDLRGSHVRSRPSRAGGHERDRCSV